MPRTGIGSKRCTGRSSAAGSVRFRGWEPRSTTWPRRSCWSWVAKFRGLTADVKVRVVTIIDLLPITIINGSRGLHTAEVRVHSSLYSGLSFRSLLSLGGGTGNAPLISLRPSLITEHHFVSTLNDLPQAFRCGRVERR